jgi:single-strand DNA-binding protein
MARATITIEGFVSKDPETRQVTGHTITSVSIPVTPQKKNQQGVYEDFGDTVWYSAELWDEHGEAAARTVRKGDLVVATGQLVVQVREKDGKTYINHTVVFPTLSVVVRKPSRAQQANQSQTEPWAASAPAQPATGGASDVWNTAGSFSDDTPF